LLVYSASEGHTKKTALLCDDIYTEPAVAVAAEDVAWSDASAVSERPAAFGCYESCNSGERENGREVHCPVRNGETTRSEDVE
jgi:hypothetical protein